MTSRKVFADDDFSCDLVHQSKCHILFLKALHSEGTTLQRPSLESLHRYKDLWLPLLLSESRKYISQELKEESDESHEVSITDLIPPSDIAWLWHCHRLAPYRYMAYVQATLLTDDLASDQMSFDAGKMSTSFERFHRERPFLFQSQASSASGHQGESEYASSCSYTQAMWKKLYPHDSFFLESQHGHSSSLRTQEEKVASNGVTMGAFDVLDSCERQSAFLWQVSGERYRDDAFLLQGVENYKKFLNLMKSNPRPKFLVPTYQIDLMWHTHMLTSITNYHKDCVRITGSIVEHNDSLTDRTEGEVLDVNFKATKKIWYEQYGDNYIVRGGMYRGEPPQAYFDTTWSRQYLLNITNNKNIVLPDGLALGHLVGEAGASSISNVSSIPWKDLDEPDAFIPPQPKSTTKGENANERIEGYIFGDGSTYWHQILIMIFSFLLNCFYVDLILKKDLMKGIGYYHMDTKEAFIALSNRLDTKLEGLKKEYDIWYKCFLCGMLGILCKDARDKVIRDIEACESIREIVSLRLSSSGPRAQLDIPDELSEKAKKSVGTRTTINDVSKPSFLAVGGGGCGGGVEVGGGGGG